MPTIWNRGPIERLIRAATKIEPDEFRATILSFGFLFSLMLAYNILKPVRDAMASDWSDTGVVTLWTINFAVSLAAVSLYGYAISRVKFRYLVLGVYAFFAASFVAFYFGGALVDETLYVDKAFYFWVSVFALFHVSVFWSLMADVFSKDEAPRLFAFIQSGASAGTLTGASIAFALARVIGTLNLMLIAAVILCAVIPAVMYLQRLKFTELGNENVNVDLRREQTIGGNPLAGFSLFLKNPYLLGIGLFILLYTAANSWVYLELKNVLAEFDRGTREQIWAGINLSINIISIAAAMFVTSHIASRFGLARTLAMVPIFVAIGLLVVAVSPEAAAIVAVQIVLKGGNYAITRPGREMLYTVVDRETRFKAKPVIDIVIYRGGDTVWGWAFAWLTAGIGLALSALAAIGAGIAVVWGLIGLYLGRTYQRAGSPEPARVEA